MTSKLRALWQRPEGRAALINAVLVMLLPLALVLIVSMGVDAGNVVRARVSTPLEYALANLFDTVAYLMVFLPLAIVAGWRTWVHASRYREGRGRGWQGVAEAGGLGVILALGVLARGIVTRPADAPPYVIFYGGVALIVGVAIGLILRVTTLGVLKLSQ